LRFPLPGKGVPVFNFFKRPTVPEVKPRPRQVATPAGAPPIPAERAPVPPTLEGNELSDWALWEDSVAALDSQLQPLAPSETVRLRGEDTPSQLQDIDPFSSIGKNNG